LYYKKWKTPEAAIIGGTGGHVPPNILVGGEANVNVPPTNCPFSYFVDICLMFASEIQLKIIIFCVLMVNLN